MTSLSEIFDAGAGRKVIRYTSEDCLMDISSCNDIVAENDGELVAILKNALDEREKIPFMSVDFEDSSEKVNEESRYI